jgi:hypothetical protein
LRLSASRRPSRILILSLADKFHPRRNGAESRCPLAECR